MKEEPLLLLSDLQKLINQVVLIDYTIIILGGENVEPNSREFYKQCAFQKFCNTVLHNEACDTHRELRRHKAKEVTFSDMTLDEARQLHTFDEYFKREAAETVFEKAGKKITPKLLLEAIRTLPEEKRKAILLYYFEGI